MGEAGPPRVTGSKSIGHKVPNRGQVKEAPMKTEISNKNPPPDKEVGEVVDKRRKRRKFAGKLQPTDIRHTCRKTGGKSGNAGRARGTERA